MAFAPDLAFNALKSLPASKFNEAFNIVRCLYPTEQQPYMKSTLYKTLTTSLRNGTAVQLVGTDGHVYGIAWGSVEGTTLKMVSGMYFLNSNGSHSYIFDEEFVFKSQVAWKNYLLSMGYSEILYYLYKPSVKYDQKMIGASLPNSIETIEEVALEGNIVTLRLTYK